MFREIHRLSGHYAAEARRQLKESGGRAYVLVHPHVSASSPSEWIFQSNLFFRTKKKNKIPVFVFEEKERIPKLLNALSNHLLSDMLHVDAMSDPRQRQVVTKGRDGSLHFAFTRPWLVKPCVILVPTEKGTPRPASESWKSLAERMKKLGVKKPLVLGRFLEQLDLQDIKKRLDEMSEDRPRTAALLNQELLRAEQAAALEKERRQKILKKYGAEFARSGSKSIGRKIKKMKKQLMESTHAGYGMCVGETHRELTLSKKFKEVRLLKNSSELWETSQPGHRVLDNLPRFWRMRIAKELERAEPKTALRIRAKTKEELPVDIEIQIKDKETVKKLREKLVSPR
ncbi:MAG: hypothetical protein NTY90_05820 [Candidatus Micrarchaeota archaeon]|nr:hypothetical protein [Candidatus Micrarchaeota archaeon]